MTEFEKEVTNNIKYGYPVARVALSEKDKNDTSY